jgi:hypothetical protein
MRSESWTFIWQPKVLMHAVFGAPPVAPLEGPDPAPGFCERGIGEGCDVLKLSLILFLRLVDAGSKGDLSRTDLEPDFLDLEVSSPRRPS